MAFLTGVICLSGAAVTVNHDLFYKDYLDGNVENWGPKIDQILKYRNKLTERNMLEVSNYLYGYIAILLNKEQEKKAERYIERWEPILDKMLDVKELECYANVYYGSVCVYKLTISNIKAVVLGAKAMSYVDDALDIDPNNPLAVGLKGNIKFYMPKGVGGDKHEALTLYKRSLELFPKEIDPLFRWNYRGMQLCLAQAYEKTEQVDKAIEVCNQIVKDEPGFKYIKNTYLPQLIFAE